MAFRRNTGEIAHLRFRDLPDLLQSGDLLVLNDTRVIRGRLRARKETGAAVEILLMSLTRRAAPGAETWEAVARPSKRLREGMRFRVGEELQATLLERRGGGRWIVRIESGIPVHQALERIGEVPLPPYIRRKPGERVLADDAVRYQTVYAANPGSVAAPTAGLHFDPEMLDRIARGGTAAARVTLSIGYGTFSPIRTDEVEDHEIHPEEYSFGTDASAAVETARGRGGRIVAVGTTSVRTIETCACPDGTVLPSEGVTRLFITPGYRFRAVDALLTNFHLPRSSLLALVMAFGGVEPVREAYRAAVAERYRFFSYGDAMFLY